MPTRRSSHTLDRAGPTSAGRARTPGTRARTDLGTPPTRPETAPAHTRNALARLLILRCALRHLEQRLADELDLDVVGVLEIDRLLDAEVGAAVLDTRGAQSLLRSLELLGS